MARLLSILATLLVSIVAFEYMAFSNEPKIRGIFDIQIGPGPVLKTIVAYDGEAFLSEVREIGNKVVDEKKFKNSPFKDESSAWRITQTERGFIVQVSGVVKRNRWYLSYDPQAPDKGVTLREEPSDGSYWDIDLGPTAVGSTEIRAKNAGHIWRLNYDKAGDQYLRNEIGVRVIETLYKLTLTKADGAKFRINHYGK